jgi:hypothetical protein
MPVKLSEEERWEVVTGKVKHYLNREEILLLKEADKAGKRSLIWYDTFTSCSTCTSHLFGL